jgi:hypothetical protein
VKKILLLIFIILIGCRKDLDIADFSFNYSGYVTELRVEALILPHDSTAIVRIDKSSLITDTDLYDCFDNDFGFITKDSCEKIENAIWHGNNNDSLAFCGDWNPLIHDLGSDGVSSKDANSDGDYEDFGDIAPDKDKTEKNGIPDCGEPNVDNYSEILPSVHNSACEVIIIKNNDYNEIDSCNLSFSDFGGQFFDENFTSDKSSPIFENIKIINYGAYVPSKDCNKDFWVDYSSEYSIFADCSNSEIPNIINSNHPISLSRPVTFFLPEDSIKIIGCADYSCLESQSSISNFTSDSLLFFPRYSSGNVINYASIIPDITYQAVQYMYNKNNNSYVYYHGHPAIGTNMLNIVDSVSVMQEAIVSEFYDGYGNGSWDNAELRTTDPNDCGLIDIYNSEGFCDFNGNAVWDDAEIYADENQNDQWDEGEFFIDTADGLPDVDTYYYEIFTFSESYENYYFNDQLFLDDTERTNLRDQNGNPILGAFGSMTSKKIYFRIIDCTIYGEQECIDNAITKSVCEWRGELENPASCYDPNESGCDCLREICLPKGFCD